MWLAFEIVMALLSVGIILLGVQSVVSDIRIYMGEQRPVVEVLKAKWDLIAWVIIVVALVLWLLIELIHTYKT